jgi:hypothetical protein
MNTFDVAIVVTALVAIAMILWGSWGITKGKLRIVGFVVRMKNERHICPDCGADITSRIIMERDE